jgi:hypothetical protein
MTARETLLRAHERGIAIWVDPAGSMHARGYGERPSALLAEIKRAEAEIVEELRDRPGHACPRCQLPCWQDLYGPCATCHAELRAKFGHVRLEEPAL